MKLMYKIFQVTHQQNTTVRPIEQNSQECSMNVDQLRLLVQNSTLQVATRVSKKKKGTQKVWQSRVSNSKEKKIGASVALVSYEYVTPSLFIGMKTKPTSKLSQQKQ